MKWKNVYPFAVACLMLALALWLYMTRVMWLGFPDGFIAELDAAEAVLVTCFNWFSLAMGIWFVVLGIRSFRNDIGRWSLYSGLLFVSVALISLAIDRYFRSFMMDSAGG
ncbi:magnesium-transporting ATPase (P-type) [Nitrobacteraceae bacterium AZCC 2161]